MFSFEQLRHNGACPRLCRARHFFEVRPQKARRTPDKKQVVQGVPQQKDDGELCVRRILLRGTTQQYAAYYLA